MDRLDQRVLDARGKGRLKRLPPILSAVQRRANARRRSELTDTWQVLHTYPTDYKVIFVGDASMSPYEITTPGGSIEHFNEEAGGVWLERVARTYPACVWLNPVPENQWDMTYSVRMIRQLVGGRMYPLTLDGLDRAMRELVR